MTRWLAPGALARAAIVWTVLSAGCAGDEIVVYRRHAARPDDGGGDPDLGESGGAPAGAGGSSGSSGDRTGGAPGMGGRAPPTSGGAPPVNTDHSGGQMSAGAGGASTAGGFGGGGFGGSILGVPATCQAASDCPGGFVCDKLDCNLPVGRCVARPIFCDATMLPACGCDGVTYWNNCYRQQNGVLGSTPGECSIAAPCMTSADCTVPGASCARLNPIPTVQCGAPVLGTCWVTPQDCAGTMPPTPTWMPCQGSAPGQSPRPTCVSTCDAIRSGQEYVIGVLGMPGMPGMQLQTCR